MCWSVDQKRLSSWHNHCFLLHKEQNLQVGGKKEKKKRIYFCTKLILSLACVLFVLWAVVYGKAYSTRQEAIQIYGERRRAFSTLVTVAFSLPFPARRCRTGMSFSLPLPVFEKGDLNFCHLFFVDCSPMFFYGQKKKKLIKKRELDWVLCCYRWSTWRCQTYKKSLLILRLWLSTENKVKLLINTQNNHNTWEHLYKPFNTKL